MKLNLYKIIFPILFTLLSFQQCFAKPLTHQDQVRIISGQLDILDKKFSIIRKNGEFAIDHFKAYNVLPHENPEKFSRLPIEKYLGSFDSRAEPPTLNYSQVIEFMNIVQPLLNPNMQSSIVIDIIDGKPVLYKSLIHYSIGYLFALQNLEHSDISHAAEIKEIKNIFLSRISPIFEISSQRPLETVWDRVYFPLFISYFTNFPVNLVFKVNETIVQAMRDKAFQGYELNAASTLMAEITMLCYSRCSEPQLYAGNIYPATFNSYLTSIFSLCDYDCNSSYTNLRGREFYKSYLELLKKNKDPQYTTIKIKVLRLNLNGILKQLNSNLNQVQQDPKQTIRFLLEIPNIIYDFIKTLLALLLFAAPLDLILFIVSIMLLVFFGGKRAQLKYYSWQRFETPISQKLKLNIALNTLYSLIINFTVLFKIFFKNAKDAFNGQTDLVYKIGYNFLLVSGTLFIANIKEYAEFNF